MIEKFTEQESKVFESGHCPDCNGTMFLHGPEAGFSENIRCKGCGHEFNFAPIPGMTERIDRNEPKWYRGEFDLRICFKDSPWVDDKPSNPWLLSLAWWKKTKFWKSLVDEVRKDITGY